jgi:hypothetical protein
MSQRSRYYPSKPLPTPEPALPVVVARLPQIGDAGEESSCMVGGCTVPTATIVLVGSTRMATQLRLCLGHSWALQDQLRTNCYRAL